MAAKKYDVIVVGELNVDLILNEIDSFPEMGKEKLAGQMTLTLGSSSAIFASNLSALGARVAFVGKIGVDSFGDLVMDSLQRKGVSTELIIRDKALSTGATIVLNYDEDRAMVTHAGAMEKLRIEDIDAEVLKTGSHLHFSSFFLQPGLKNDVAKMFRLARAAGLTTSFDAQWDPAEKWDLDYQNIIPFVDVFLPNKLELLYITASSSIEDALHKIGKVANGVVVKMGNQGSILWKEGKQNNLPAFLNPRVVDAIGAGDSFNAGFVFKYIQKTALGECQKFANLMGAINTTASGGTTAFTDYRKIMALAKEKFAYIDDQGGTK